MESATYWRLRNLILRMEPESFLYYIVSLPDLTFAMRTNGISVLTF